jgi:glycine/D-amino acid oxidase-like deaminating enzyme
LIGGHTKAASYRTFPENVEKYGLEEAIKITRLEHTNIRSTHAFAKQHSLDCESRPCNTVDIIYDAENFIAAKRAVEIMRRELGEDDSTGAGWYRVYEQEEAIQKFFVAEENMNPVMKQRDSVAGAIEYEAGSISAYEFASGVLEMCVKKGMGLQTWTPVIALKRINFGNSRWAIQTERGTVTANRVVLATNGYTVRLLPWLQKLIVPVRGHIQALVPGPQSTLPAPLPTTYSFIYRDGYEYMIPRLHLPGNEQHIVMGGGLMLLPNGGESEFGTCDDSYVNPLNTKYLLGSGFGYFGRNWGTTAHQTETAKEWTGIMGFTLDDHPFVGEVPSRFISTETVNEGICEKSGLFVAAGFNGHGMVLCLKSAEALVHCMMEGNFPEWFPKSFVLSDERIESLKTKIGYTGRRRVVVHTEDSSLFNESKGVRAKI